MPSIRRVRGYAKAHGIPVIDCAVGERKHDLEELYLTQTKVTRGLFLILVGRARAPVWDIGANHHLERKTPVPYVNHYSFHILHPDWGHITIKLSGHPPFPAQVGAAHAVVDWALRRLERGGILHFCVVGFF